MRSFVPVIRKGIIALLSSVVLLPFALAAAKAPNIVLMVADDHGREVFGAYGNKVIRTPHLDQLAAEGARFNNAYGTTASCSASRSVLLTGLHNHKNGQYGHEHGYHHFRTFNDIKSLPVRLSAAGYRTARVGKYHIGPAAVYKFDKVLNDFKGTNDDGSRNTIGMAHAAKKFISAKTDKPFFLYVATNDPHRDHSFNTLGDNTFGNKRDNGEGMARLDYKPEEVEIPDYLPDTPETRRELTELYQSVSRVDDTAGELVKQLKEAGVYDNTLFIYLSDNGTAMPGAKTTIYEPGVKLPLIVRLPEGYEFSLGKVLDEMVSWPDITPTILDVAGVKYSQQDFHGRSFKDVIQGKANTKEWNEVYGSHTFHEITMYYPMRMVRKGKYKLIWNIASGLDYPFASDLFISSTWQSAINRNLNKFGARTLDAYIHRPKFELYNVEIDPAEGNNLADDADYQAIKQELMTKLKAFQEHTEDPWVVKWNYE